VSVDVAPARVATVGPTLSAVEVVTAVNGGSRPPIGFVSASGRALCDHREMGRAQPWWRQATGAPPWFGRANEAARRHPYPAATFLSLPIPLGSILQNRFILHESWSTTVAIALGLAIVTFVVWLSISLGRRTDR